MPDGSKLAGEINLTSLATKAEIAKEGYDPTYGARPLDRLIQTEIKDGLSEEILFGRLNKGGVITVDLKDGKLVFV